MLYSSIRAYIHVLYSYIRAYIPDIHIYPSGRRLGGFCVSYLHHGIPMVLLSAPMAIWWSVSSRCWRWCGLVCCFPEAPRETWCMLSLSSCASVCLDTSLSSHPPSRLFADSGCEGIPLTLFVVACADGPTCAKAFLMAYQKAEVKVSRFLLRSSPLGERVSEACYGR